MGALRQVGNPVETFLVERYWPGVTIETFADAVRRLNDSVAGLRRQGIPIEAMTATLAPNDEAAYWIVDGPSAAAVELAFGTAGVPIERIVPAIELRRPQTTSQDR
ncbi:MAG TPA: hypothetical protein VFI15_07850 [Candidatus Limnocylindrales bacterium]|nr:hypothetical protein [Candidatus Limnocylindrales bacterium]